MTTVGPEPPLLPIRILGWTIRWAPVWVPIIMIWQIVTFGLNPALAESKRLEEATPAVMERFAQSQAQFESMAAQRRAWEDETYRERVRRMRAADREAGR